MAFANGIFGLVNESQQHAHPDEKGNDDQKDSPQELDRTEYCFGLGPRFHEPTVPFSTGFRRKAFSSDKCTFFSDQRL